MLACISLLLLFTYKKNTLDGRAGVCEKSVFQGQPILALVWSVCPVIASGCGTHFDDVRDPQPAPVLERGAVGRDLDERRLGAGPAAAAHAARLLLAPARLRVRRPPPHVEHDGA